jgi:signal transduction histidine kinase
MNPTPARSARVWRRVRTAALILVAFVSVTVGVAYYDARQAGLTTSDVTAPGTGWSLFGWFAAMVVVGSLGWRKRWPWPVFLACCIATIVLPIDGFLPLAGLFAVLMLGLPRAHAAGAIGLSAVAVGVSIARDVNGGVPSVSSLWRSVFPYDRGTTFPWWLILILTVVLVGLDVLVVALLRSRRALDTTTRSQAIATVEITRLSEEVARRAERERIAREIHDALGHRLSLLNLHAGALELAAGDNPKLAQSARVVRESAQQSMTDLRSLLGLLREPGDPDVSKALLTLNDLPRLIDESLAAGSPVASSIFIDDSSPLDQQVSHTVYRITQELLTNARKHSPREMIRLHLEARPSGGIEISTANRMAPGTQAGFRPGNGLTGIHERVTQCGGESWAWIDETGAFRALVRLPWQFRPTQQKAHR